MSILIRKLQKIFGNDAAVGEFGVIGSDFTTPTNSKDLDTIQGLQAYLDGMFAITNSAAEPPRIEDFNSLHYMWASQLKYMFQSGIPEWITTEDYFANISIVQVSGKVYVSLTGTGLSPNIGNDPTSDIVNWKKVVDKDKVYIEGNTSFIIGNLMVGSSETPSSLLEVVGSGSRISGGSSKTDSTSKSFIYSALHYSNSENPSCLAVMFNSSASNEVRIGGGSPLVTASTKTSFWGASNNTTTTGTELARIIGNGNFGLGGTQDPERLFTLSKSTGTIYGGAQLNSGETNTSRIFEWGIESIGSGTSDLKSSIQFRTIADTSESDSDIGFFTNNFGVSRSERMTLDKDGVLSIYNSTNSTSKDSGAFIVTAGGLGVEQDGYFGGKVTANGGFSAEFRNSAGAESSTAVKTKVIELGDWNMDSVSGISGLILGVTVSSIREIQVIIRNDDNTKMYPLTIDRFLSGTPDGTISEIDISSNNINMQRRTSGFFDSVDFDATSYNRGWVYITYEV